MIAQLASAPHASIIHVMKFRFWFALAAPGAMLAAASPALNPMTILTRTRQRRISLQSYEFRVTEQTIHGASS